MESTTSSPEFPNLMQAMVLKVVCSFLQRQPTKMQFVLTDASIAVMKVTMLREPTVRNQLVRVVELELIFLEVKAFDDELVSHRWTIAFCFKEKDNFWWFLQTHNLHRIHQS